MDEGEDPEEDPGEDQDFLESQEDRTSSRGEAGACYTRERGCVLGCRWLHVHKLSLDLGVGQYTDMEDLKKKTCFIQILNLT